MEGLASGNSDHFIRDIDLMARAAYTWVRQQSFACRFRGLPLSLAEECELAAGFLDGLQRRLNMDMRDLTMVAYSYALMAGQRTDPLRLATEILNYELPASNSDLPPVAAGAGFQQGLQAARDLLIDSGHHDRANSSFAGKCSETLN
jgi:hypothetical protein